MLFHLLAAEPAWSAALFAIRDIGLTDAEHTSSIGLRNSYGYQLNAAGQVMGSSLRYSGSSESGRSAWLYNGMTTLNIGLTDAEHTSGGYRSSLAKQLNEVGQVLGHANRYSGDGGFGGQSVWLYDGMTTLKIGLTGAEHTSSGGFKYSDVWELNETGEVIGFSFRYNSGSQSPGMGSSIWLHECLDDCLPGQTASAHNIGLTDAEHTRNDGYQLSQFTVSGSNAPKFLNEAGQVIGHSRRYNGGGTDLGVTAWLYNGTTTLNIGLVDYPHTSRNGYKESAIQGLNAAGQVIGVSTRFADNAVLGYSAWLYNGTTTLNIGLVGSGRSSVSRLNEGGQAIGVSDRPHNGGGLSAWLYDGTTTVTIGLTGAEHTRNDGFKESRGEQFNEAGNVLGYSLRYNGGSADFGRSVWLYDGITTLDIGLTDGEHTRDGGYRYSAYEVNYEVDLFNEAGQVVGYSRRYNGGNSQLGESVWLYNGMCGMCNGTTVNIGLADAEHTTSNGSRYSGATRLNEASQVTGYTDRYNGDIYLGRDAWVYDPVLGTVPLQLFVRSDGYAYSESTFLGENGVVLGFYKVFNGMTYAGERALYWSPDEGLHDLGQLINGGLDDNGWAALHRSIQVNGLGQILGYGVADGLLSSPIRSAYLLTPVSEQLIPGDYDRDDDVDGADFLKWQREFGSTLPRYDGSDGNGDGSVDAADYVVWRDNLGSSTALARSSVPEPASLVLVVVGFVCALLRGRPRLRNQRTSRV